MSASPAVVFGQDCMVAVLMSTSTGQLVAKACGRWSCLRCGPVAKHKFLLRTMSITYNWMITVTYEDRTYLRRARENERPDQYINRCWRSFSQWLRRNYGAVDFQTSWSNEHGKVRGRAHKHAVVKLSRAPNYKRARRALKRCGLGRQSHFDRITDADGAACYLGKYIAKALTEEWPRYARRCQNAAPRWYEPMQSDIRNGDVEPNIFKKYEEPLNCPTPRASWATPQWPIDQIPEELEDIFADVGEPRPPPQLTAVLPALVAVSNPNIPWC